MLMELRTYHLAEAMRPRETCDLTAFAQAQWHLEVANQTEELAKAFTAAFPGLRELAEDLPGLPA